MKMKIVSRKWQMIPALASLSIILEDGCIHINVTTSVSGSRSHGRVGSIQKV